MKAGLAPLAGLRWRDRGIDHLVAQGIVGGVSDVVGGFFHLGVVTVEGGEDGEGDIVALEVDRYVAGDNDRIRRRRHIKV